MKDFLNKEREEMFKCDHCEGTGLCGGCMNKNKLCNECDGEFFSEIHITKDDLKAHDTRVVEKVVEMIDGMEKPLCRCICDNTRRANAYNQALKDLSEALKED